MPVPTTQEDIAQALGISRMAVSLALRNSPRVSSATRLRVAELAVSMGYQINPYARTLRIQGSKPQPDRLPLALLNLWNPPSLWKATNWSRLVTQGCVERASELGYYMEEIQLRAPGMTAKLANQILRNRGIRGILVVPMPNSHGHLKLEWEHFAAGAIGLTFRRPNIHRVALNFSLSMQLALHHLKHAGYRRIGLLLAKSFVRRMDGGSYAAFLHYQDGIPRRERIPTYWSEGHDFSRLSAWLKRHRPEVVLTYWPSVFNWLKDAGYSIPGDIGFVLFGSIEEQRLKLGIQPTGINVEDREMGSRAVDLIVNQLERNEFGIPTSPTITLITPRWIPGETIRTSSR